MDKKCKKHIIALLTAGLSLGTLVNTSGLNTATVSAEESAQSDELSSFENAIFNAVSKADEAVVSISNMQYQDKPETMTVEDLIFSFRYPYYYRLEEPEEREQELVLASEGSGVVYKSDDSGDYIITNNHVINGADEIVVTVKDGSTSVAELVGTDALTDLAVLKLEDKIATKVIEFADSDAVQVGALAIAIGSPMGSTFSNSVTQGIVSGLDREVPVDIDEDGNADWIANLLQTDAAINPGNSGGALVDRNGRLIGINSSKLSKVGVEGMGFAIPSNQVQTVVAQLEENGEVIRPTLGVGIADLVRLHPEDRETLNVPEEYGDDGVVITKIEKGSSAEKGGMRAYDVVVQVNDRKIRTTADLKLELYRHHIGETINVKVLRNGKEVDLEITLDDYVDDEDLDGTEGEY